jgi:hypothetical protein
VDDELLRLLAESNCFRISYGIESANDFVLEKMRKKISVAQVDEALSRTRDSRIGIQGNLIFGDPHETFEHAKVSLDWWEAHSEYALNMGYIFAYPRSRVYSDALERDIIRDKLQFIAAGCPVVNMSAMSDTEFRMLDVLKWRLISMHRRFATLTEIFPAPRHPGRNVALYDFKSLCPYCSAVDVYRNFHIPDMSIMKVSCKTCHQRFDVTPLAFLAEKPVVDENVTLLFKAIQSHRPVVVLPRIDEDSFMSVMENKCFPWNIMNISYCFDMTKTGPVTKFLADVPVLPLSEDTIADKCRGTETVFLLIGEKPVSDEILGLLSKFRVPTDQTVCFTDNSRLPLEWLDYQTSQASPKAD